MRTLKLAAAVLAAVVSASAAAQADSFRFSFNTGDVAFAYQDGWWDNHHR